MTLDLAVVGLLLLAAVGGAFGGALRQVLKLAAVVGGWAAARWVGPRVVQQFQPSTAAARALVIAGVFVAGWALAVMLGQLIRRAVQREEEGPGQVDRLLGALLGAAKGALVAWVLLSGLALLGGRLSIGALRVESRGSWAAALAARWDLLAMADPRASRSAQRLVEIWRDPARRERLLRDPGWRRLLEGSALRSALDRGAAGADGTRELLADPQVKALLEQLSVEP